MNESVAIHLEFTPNPNTLKFVVNRQLLPSGAANFTSHPTPEESPLASTLFGVEGVQAVMIGKNFVTITKAEDGNWDLLAEKVPLAVEAHLASNTATLGPSYVARDKAEGPTTEIETKIREILDEEIRPAVAMDGGDITFGKYEDGIVYLHLQGACSSCPSSVATLKMGVESRLKEAVPEIKEVVQM